MPYKYRPREDGKHIIFNALCISASFRAQIFAEIKLFLRPRRWKTCLVHHNIKPGIVHRHKLQGLCFRNGFHHKKA